MKALVLIETVDAAVSKGSLATVTAAQKVAKEIDVLLLGHQIGATAKQAASIQGIHKVYLAEAPMYANCVAEDIANLVCPLANDYHYILAPANTFGKNCLPRIAGMLSVGQISDVIAIQSEDTFIRPIYAGDALATVRSEEALKLITVRPTAFEPAVMSANADVEIISLNLPTENSVSTFIALQTEQTDEPELTSAKIVVSGGRGLQNAENFALIQQLAKALGAAVGATRAAVDAGYVSNDRQVGQTGKVVAPELYIAIGISGAVQHVAGMKDSKVIVAINKDPDAPIFESADYALVGDLFEIVPEWIEKIG